MIARDELAQKGIEMEFYKTHDRDEVSEALYRYDMNATYYVRG